MYDCGKTTQLMIMEITKEDAEYIRAEFANASSPTKTAKAPSKEEGVVYVASGGTYYESPEITADKIVDLLDNIYIRGVIVKQLNLIFQKKYTIEVIDTKTRKVDEELSNTLMAMSETKDVRLWANMQRAYIDHFTFGIGLYNPVWGVDKEALEPTNDTRLLKLRHLPPETFKTEPSGVQDIYSQILRGIILNAKGETEYWQEPEPGETPVQIKNIFYVKKPTDRGLAGDPIIIPLIPIIEMLRFTWNTEMQQVNRIGAKILFIKVTNPQPASTRNGNKSDVEYANAIIQNWGKDTAFQLRENMELIDLNLKDDSNNLEIIDALNNMIIEYVTPASFISNQQETRLGGNDNAQKELLDNYIKGVHQWLAEQFEMLLMRYLEYNQFQGYTVSIKIPEPSHDTEELNRKRAESGFLTQCLDVNERRKLLGHEPKDEAALKEMAKYYSELVKTEQLIKPS